MAQVKLGALAVEVRGSVGLETYSKNRGGMYLKSRSAPPFTQTTAQMACRAYITSASQYWRTLTDAQRLHWEKSSMRYNPHNIFGDVRPYSGYTFFMKVNVNRQIIGLAKLAVFPGKFTLGYQGINSIVADNSAQSLLVNLSVAISNDYAVVFYATGTVSPGRSSKSVNFYQIYVRSTYFGLGVTITTPYLAKFGTIGSVGDRIFVKIRAIEKSTGMPGVCFIASTIIVN